MTGECRSLDPDRVQSVRDAMDAAMRTAATDAGGSVEISWNLEYSGFESSVDSQEIALVSTAARDVGREPSTFSSGGGSDANVLAALGVPTLALACGMKGVHGLSEEIAVDDLCALARICEAVAFRMARAGSG
jgi:tripeptide aminopeptidase